ncbi:MAG: Npt1/Npt2 family nucleotide transporter [Thermoanaerobaculia bacterium]
MRSFRHLIDWLDIRPRELKPLLLCFGGAFFLIAAFVLSRSLREAFYLATFDVRTLPYITVGTTVLGLPTVALFAWALTRFNARKVVRVCLVVFGLGLAVLMPLIAEVEAAVVAFYLWTALGTMVIASGFWIVASEHFALREAKRLFGLISAGGTAGAMVMGNSLRYLTRQFDLVWLVPLLVALVGLLFVTQFLLPSGMESKTEKKTRKDDKVSSAREGLKLVWGTPHLAMIATIVMLATMSSTLVDYQFKEAVRATLTTKQELASFFGSFYGWTGAASLLIQLFLTSRLMAARGVAISLSLLPVALMMGSVGVLLFPALLTATLLRGADNSLRKSLHRSVLEVCYVPLPSLLRRKTKTFIDTVLDSLAEGLGAGVVFIWVTWGNMPSRYLSVVVMALCSAFLYVNRRMGRVYFETVVDRLKGGSQEADQLMADADFHGRDLLNATFTRLDIPAPSVRGGEPLPVSAADPMGGGGPAADSQTGTPGRIDISSSEDLSKALDECTDWNEQHIPRLIRLLARDVFCDRAVFILASLGEPAVEHLARLLADDDFDFVVRRRIPRVLAGIDSPLADRALLDGLTTSRFEVRYRSAIALVRRLEEGRAVTGEWWEEKVWEALRSEVGHERPVWEMQRLLDDSDTEADELVQSRIGDRGGLSLEHAFRLLTLVLDPKPVRVAFQGILQDNDKLRSISLEFLEHVLPKDIRERLWPFIGDISDHQRQRSIRPVEKVVSELVETAATLFASDQDRQVLRQMLE